MSAGGHSLHKKDWLKVGAGAALAVAAPYALPAAASAAGGLLGGAAADAAITPVAAATLAEGAAIPGASGMADLIGASGAAPTVAPSVASPSLLSAARMDVQNAGFNAGLPTGWDANIGKGLKGMGQAARFAGLLGGQQQQGMGGARPPPMGQFGNTSIYGSQAAGYGTPPFISPEQEAELRRRLQQGQSFGGSI